VANSRFELFVAEVHRDPALSGVLYDVFALSTHQHADFPRVNWVPRRGRVERIKDSGGCILFGNQAQTGQALRQQLNFTDQVEVEVQCWGEDFQQAEELRNDVVAALWRRCMADVKFGEYEWAQEQHGEYLQRGALVTFTATVNIAVATDHDRTTRVAAQTHRGDFTSDLTGTTEQGVC
jgi:hypothetical protein